VLIRVLPETKYTREVRLKTWVSNPWSKYGTCKEFPWFDLFVMFWEGGTLIGGFGWSSGFWDRQGYQIMNRGFEGKLG
jgi:hypothetical protein